MNHSDGTQSSRLESTKNDRPAKPRRRWLVSVKIFLVVNAVLGSIGVGLWGIKIYRHNSRLTAALAELDAHTQPFYAHTEVPGYIPGWARWKWVTNYFTNLTMFQVNLQPDRPSKLDNDSLGVIAAAPGLKAVNLLLRTGTITDDALMHFSQQTGILEFAVPKSNFSDAGLKHLETLVELRELIFNSPAITDRGLVSLRGMKQLQILVLADSEQITDEGLEAIGSLPIEHLDIQSAPITDKGLAILARMPRINNLIMEKADLTADGLRAFGEARPLTGFSIAGQATPAAFFQVLEHFPGIRTLSLKNTSVDEAQAARLKEIPQLRQFDLADVILAPGTLERIAELDTLNTLTLQQANLADDDLNKLVSLAPSLTDLSLLGNRITDKGLITVSRFTKLQFLSLEETEITDAGLVHLEALKSLSILYVGNTAITEEGKTRLQKVLPTVQIWLHPLPRR